MKIFNPIKGQLDLKKKCSKMDISQSLKLTLFSIVCESSWFYYKHPIMF